MLNNSDSLVGDDINEVGVMANFLIYCLTLRSFRGFLKSKLSGLPRFFSARRTLTKSAIRPRLAPNMKGQEPASTEDMSITEDESTSSE